LLLPKSSSRVKNAPRLGSGPKYRSKFYNPFCEIHFLDKTMISAVICALSKNCTKNP